MARRRRGGSGGVPRSVVETLAAAEAGAAPVGFPRTFETPGAAPRALLAARLEFPCRTRPPRSAPRSPPPRFRREEGHHNAALAAAGAGGDTQAAALAAGWLAAHGRPALRAALHARAAEAPAAAVHGVGVGGAYEPTERSAARRLWRASSVRAAPTRRSSPRLFTSIATAARAARRRRCARRRRHRAARRAAAGGRAVRAARALGRGGAAAGERRLPTRRARSKDQAALKELSPGRRSPRVGGRRADGAALEDAGARGVGAEVGGSHYVGADPKPGSSRAHLSLCAKACEWSAATTT